MSFVLLNIVLAMSVGEHLDNGATFLEHQAWKMASDSFNAAINTNRLNTAGEATCYWNIYLAELNLGHKNKKIMALLDFKTMADEVSDSDSAYIIGWIKAFDTKKKLEFANMALQAYWAGENNYSCRSKMFSCFIYDESNISIFKETVPFCEGSELQGYRINRSGNLLETDILCAGEKQEKYHFNLIQ